MKRYWIVKFSTRSGGGIAFVPFENNDAQDTYDLVLYDLNLGLNFNYTILDAVVIGTVDTIDVTSLHYDEETDIYYYGGDCC